MCGLFGLLLAKSFSDQADRDERLMAAQAALHHRGPDDHGLESFSVRQGNDVLPFELTLGHTRLSIIDLSPGGHQPMHSGDGRFTMVFNGEIYNYRELRQELKALSYSFHTDSDTEVLLAVWAQWGIDGLRRLTGMFAFAVYDRRDQSLTLVRDAFGIKPLFYQQDASGFRFASEIPALLCLLEDEPELNYQRAYDYLVFGSYDNTTDTFYQGIHHLLPGHWLRVELKGYRVGDAQRWWWPSIEERTDLSFDDAAAQLREMFLNNVRLHMRSDVPLGAALSGGIDSSSVVCAMRQLEPDLPIHTFSFIAHGSNVNEEKWVDIVNAHVSAIPHKVVVETDELADSLDDVIHTQGEPFGGTSIYAQYRVFKAAREAGIIVTLDGQGADEMLAGYTGYPDSYLRSLFDRKHYIDATKFLWHWSKWPNRGTKLALLMLGSVLIPRQFRELVKRAIWHDPTPTWLEIDSLREKGVLLGFREQAVYGKEAWGRELVAQLRRALTGNGISPLLRHGDRNSMRWSIESRVPFLTIDLAEFLLSLPESYLLSPQGETKHVFRAAMRGLVPDAILDRRDKTGFQTPEQDWFQGQGAWVQDCFLAVDSLPFLKGQICRDAINKVLIGNKTFSHHMWRLINYCRWIQLQENLENLNY